MSKAGEMLGSLAILGLFLAGMGLAGWLEGGM
jgi:hypothetical protein